MPEVSVVIVMWNAAPTLGGCLEALASSPTELEVICVDNASADRSAELATAAGAMVLQPGRNLGFPAAVNLALPHCTADHVLLLNPDVVIEPAAIERCIAVLASPGVGVAGANLTREDGTPDWPAARRFRTLPLLAIETIALQKVWHGFDRQYLPASRRTVDVDVECINGAFMLLRRDLFEELGGLDDTVFLFLEDQDLCLRMRRRGLAVRFVADAAATHTAGAATGSADESQRATIFLHRMDASIELINRLHGSAQRRVALLLWTLRCTIGSVTMGLITRADRLRYLGGLRWLSRQWHGRIAPPPVS